MTEKKEKYLYQSLVEYQESDYYPFHMPGHKRNLEKLPKWNPYGMDITEIDGFDNLHDAKEILSDSMKRVAKFRGAEESFYLINGTTCGLLSGIAACCNRGDKILIGRNCHKAVYHGLSTLGLVPVYIYPQSYQDFHINCGYLSENIEKMLTTHKDIKLVLLTSPTYEGVVSDIDTIAKIVHKYHIPLMVDQAHGAHFGMHKDFPKSAIELGTDIVVESVHKTLPAYTQTALLHIQGNLVNRRNIRKFLGIYQTSSPSYVMMAGIEWCQQYCAGKEGKRAFETYAKELYELRVQFKQFKFIKLFDPPKGVAGCKDYDAGKLVFGAVNNLMSGQELYDRLRDKYHLQLEMASLYYVIAMTSVMDRKEGFDRLLEALKEIDKELEQKYSFIRHKREVVEQNFFEKKQDYDIIEYPIKNQQIYIPFDGETAEGEWVSFHDSCGRISKSYLYLYPPGIPFLVPGEEINREMIEFAEECIGAGLEIKGMEEEMLEVMVHE